jgi:hypothetical protein
MAGEAGTGRDAVTGGAARWAAAAGLRGSALGFLAFAAISLVVLAPALAGLPVSDDLVYIVYNPYIAALTAENLLAILDPWGGPTLYTVNYAPVHMLLHALEFQLFGGNVVGYHVVNALVHALNATLLVALLRSSRVAAPAAWVGGLLFTVHPANVEAVAWMFQLKTSAALALSLAALLAQRRRPALATFFFALALLTKATAAFALPMAAAFVWARRGSEGGSRRDGLWLAAWAAVLALYAVPELTAFGYAAAVEVPAFEDRWVQLRTMAAIGMRYLVMPVTAHGVSAFQEPSPALSPLDPWWLAALPAGALLAVRTGVTWVRRREEAAWWLGSAAAFAFVCQIFPFVYPVADRYLYFILPGLIGGGILWGQELAAGGWRRRRAAARRPGDPWQGLAGPAVLAGVLVALAFAVRAHERARLWVGDERLLIADAARHYPDGGNAHFLAALRAIERGDEEAAVAALRAAVDRGYDHSRAFDADPLLDPIRDAPGFELLMREVAARHIEYGRERGSSSQIWLRSMALAHQSRGEYAEAASLLERAIRTEGPLEQSLLISEFWAAHQKSLRQRRQEGEAVPTHDPSKR